MDMVSPILDIASRLWTCTANHASYICGLEDTLNSLRSKMDELIARRDDVQRRVQLEEQEGKVQTSQVQHWLSTVEVRETEVNAILSKHESISSNGSTCLRTCRCRSSYKLGKKSAKLLIVIQELINQLESTEIALPQPRPALTKKTEGLCEMPMVSHNLVGIDSTLEKVMTVLKDDNVGIIGLYGMGGVGKTTLLIKINNELHKSGDEAFDCALWIVASGNATIGTIQQDIAKNLGIALSDKSEYEIRNEIYNTLKNRKYILMLDDVWKMIELLEGVGIPKPNYSNGSKIIFTTRLKGVSFEMGAHTIIEVQCLPWEEAWSLFQEKVGKATLSPPVESYAKKVAKECNGLPLALITIGRAMSGKVEPREWAHALNQLQNYPAEIPDLGKKVFPKLKLSYDYLADSTTQKCFLYCSLFPEDYIIETDNLVNLWMGEGYLNKKHNIKSARDSGYCIIEDLKRACLLESVSTNFESVKMHDVLRDMALWIAEKEFLFLDKVELMKAKSVHQDWNEDVEKMSLWGSGLEYNLCRMGKSLERDQEELSLTRECPSLSTLLYKYSPSVSLLRLLNFIPNVRVLDLSKSNIGYLPKEISKFENLEYLDISETTIRRLPKEMKSLRKLEYLLMIMMLHLKEFPAEIISGLTELLVFRMYHGPPSSEEVLRSLEKLQNMQEIGIKLDSDKTMKIFQMSKKLQLCTTIMNIEKMYGELLELCPTNMMNVEYLSITNCKLNAIRLRKLKAFNCLRDVTVGFCDGMKELDMLVYAPSLIHLRVYDCRSIERIVQVEEAESVFLSLKIICLRRLPSLQNICNKPLSFPSLVTTEIENCPKLKQNPFSDVITTNNY